LFIIVYFLFCVCVLRRTIYNNDNIINTVCHSGARCIAVAYVRFSIDQKSNTYSEESQK